MSQAEKRRKKRQKRQRRKTEAKPKSYSTAEGGNTLTHQDETLTQQELDQLTKTRRRLVANRLATVVSVAEDLLSVLDSPLRSTVEDLLSALAALTSMTDPSGSTDWRSRRSPNYDSVIPSPDPAWAKKKVDQIDRQLYELVGMVDGWCHRPYDPHSRRGLCVSCSGKLGREDRHCRHCGEPTLRNFRRERDAHPSAKSNSG